jgi:hypothetical protein
MKEGMLWYVYREDSTEKLAYQLINKDFFETKLENE